MISNNYFFEGQNVWSNNYENEKKKNKPRNEFTPIRLRVVYLKYKYYVSLYYLSLIKYVSMDFF